MGDGTYAVNFKDADGQDVFVRVDGDLWSYGVPSTPTPVYAQLGNGALWTWAATRVALGGNLLAALRNE